MEVTGRQPPARQSVSSGELRREGDCLLLKRLSQAGPACGEVWSWRARAPERQLNEVRKHAIHTLVLRLQGWSAPASLLSEVALTLLFQNPSQRAVRDTLSVMGQMVFNSRHWNLLNLVGRGGAPHWLYPGAGALAYMPLWFLQG